MSVSTKPKVKPCKFCDDDVVFVDVAIGQRQERVVHTLPIDAEPHDDGRVVERDGTFRLLAGRKQPMPNEATYRLHGSSNCGPGARRDPR